MNNIIEDYNSNNPGHVWRNYKYDLSKCADIAKYIARHRYAWPGGHALFAITDDGGALCNKCCHSEFYLIASSYPGDGWYVVAVDSTVNYDYDDEAESFGITCDHCGADIS